MVEPIAEALAQFGVAGLMGALWVWERSMSRKRESELSASHQRLMSQRYQLRELVRALHRNTRAFERFEQSQNRLRELLERMNRDDDQKRAA